MRKFIYTIQDANGVHARPAGLLVKAAKALDSTITLENAAGKSAVATKLIAVMGLGIKQGDINVLPPKSTRAARKRPSANSGWKIWWSIRPCSL